MKEVDKEVFEVMHQTPESYLSRILEKRNPGPKAEGPMFMEEQTYRSLIEEKWINYYHDPLPKLRGLKAYATPIGGFTDVQDITDIPHNKTLILRQDGLHRLVAQVALEIYDREIVGETILFAVLAKCNVCRGTGKFETRYGRLTTGMHSCVNCNGIGKVRQMLNLHPGSPREATALEWSSIKFPGRELTVNDAKRYGVTKVQVISMPEPPQKLK